MPPLLQVLRTPPETPPHVTERLRQYAALRTAVATAERCEFCGAEMADEHGHLVDLPRRSLLCVCRPCYLLFTQDGSGGHRFRAVPTRYVLLSEFTNAGAEWDALDVPIGLAFMFRSSATGRTTAFYPSPAGATESELSLAAWQALVETMPALSTMSPDVEALLVRRTDRGGVALIVPIDICYELVGLIRVAWRGLHGGDDLHRHLDGFFAHAIARARRSSV